jgi:predicted metalloprotease with PDZ domain
MEHRNSTVLTGTTPLSAGALSNLGTLSHEFFHGWNVERIRPRSLEPFDFEAANMSGELWFAEGFTSYYDALFIRRAGLTDNESYARGISGSLNTVINGPGRRLFSPVEMSMKAPLVDAATSVDLENRANTFISYYTWGSAIGLGLDLTLRTRFDRTLDDYMRAMWMEFGRTERPYTPDDLRNVLADVAGDAAFAREFFDRYVEGTEVMDYEELLSHSGYLLRLANPSSAWLGARISNRNGQAMVASIPSIGSPLYDAGLDEGAVIAAVDGSAVSAAEFLRIVASRNPGDRLPMTYQFRGSLYEATVVLTEDPAIEVVTFETSGRPVTDPIRAFRDSWFGSRAR